MRCEDIFIIYIYNYYVYIYTRVEGLKTQGQHFCPGDQLLEKKMFCGLAQTRWTNTRIHFHNSFLKDKGKTSKKKSDTAQLQTTIHEKKKCVKLGLPEHTLHKLLCTKWKRKKIFQQHIRIAHGNQHWLVHGETKSQLRQEKKNQEQNKTVFLIYFYSVLSLFDNGLDKYSAISIKNKRQRKRSLNITNKTSETKTL